MSDKTIRVIETQDAETFLLTELLNAWLEGTFMIKQDYNGEFYILFYNLMAREGRERIND